MAYQRSKVYREIDTVDTSPIAVETRGGLRRVIYSDRQFAASIMKVCIHPNISSMQGWVQDC